MITTLLFDFRRVIAFTSGEISAEDLADFQIIDCHDQQGSAIYLNKKLLNFVEKHHSNKTTAIISASDVLIKNQAVLKFIEPYFDHILSTVQLGMTKDEPDVFKEVARMVNAKPEEMLFTDDRDINIKAAQTAHVKSVKFFTTDNYITEAEAILTE
jgi:HAD superfamily hydrolase (TIGR01509 family)